MPEEVEHNVPGSVDLLMFENDKSLYLATSLFKNTEKYGNTFNLTVMFEDRGSIGLEIEGFEVKPAQQVFYNSGWEKSLFNGIARVGLFWSHHLTRGAPIKAVTWKNTVPGQPDLYIPPSTRCLYFVLLMHRRKDLTGPEALTFDPEQFIEECVQKYLVPNPFIFLPFNAGPRIYLGQQFAYNEISFMLVRLPQLSSSIKLRQDAHPESVPPPGVERSSYAVDGLERVWVRSHLTAYAKNGLWVEMGGGDDRVG